MIEIYRLGDDFKFTKYDTWNDGKFSGPLSGLDIKESEVRKRFNTLYYRTGNGDELKGEKAEKIEINIKEL